MVLNSISSEILFTFQIVGGVLVVLGFHCSVAAVHKGPLLHVASLVESTDSRASDLSS